MKPGVYETIYGNSAVVTDESLKTRVAYDLDMGEDIPIMMVDEEKLISENYEDYI